MRQLIPTINKILLAIPPNGIPEIALMGLVNNIKNGFIEHGLENEDYYWRRLSDVVTDWYYDTKNEEIYEKLTNIVSGVGEDNDIVVIDVVGDLAKDLFSR